MKVTQAGRQEKTVDLKWSWTGGWKMIFVVWKGLREHWPKNRDNTAMSLLFHFLAQ